MSQNLTQKNSIELVFDVIQDSQSVKISNKSTYSLSKKLSLKEIRGDRKMRRKQNIVKVNRPESTFAVAQSRITF